MSRGQRMEELYEYETPDGEVFVLNDYGARSLLGIDNLGQPDTEYRTSRGPYQDGETVRGRVYRPRVVQIVFRYQGADRNDWWAVRARILDTFRANRPYVTSSTTGTSSSSPIGIEGIAPSEGKPRDILSPGILRIRKPDGNSYRLYVFPENGPGMNIRLGNDDWDDFAVVDSLRLIAFDPLFYADTAVTSTIIPGDLGDQLVFPITFPISFTYAYLVHYADVTYTGTYKCFPIIRVHGPANQVHISNTTTGISFYSTYNIAQERSMTFDLTAQRKLVYDDFGNNLIGTIKGDLGQFALEPNPLAPGGVNRISIFGTNLITSQTSLYLQYWPRYTGI